jgi:hypothetical protein
MGQKWSNIHSKHQANKSLKNHVHERVNLNIPLDQPYSEKSTLVGQDQS